MSVGAAAQKRSRLELVRPGADRCEVCPTRAACVAAQLDGLDRGELPRYFREVNTLRAGDHLFEAGAPAIGQYHVRSGMVKTYVVNANGDEFVTGFHLPGDVIGLGASGGRYSESAVALDTSSLCLLLEEDLIGAERLVPGLMRHLGERAGREIRQQLNLKQPSSQARFAGFCVLLAERMRLLGRCPSHLPTPMSRTDIASYLGMTLESLSRVVSKLNGAGVIRASRHSIEIVQHDKLAALGAHVAA